MTTDIPTEVSAPKTADVTTFSSAQAESYLGMNDFKSIVSSRPDTSASSLPSDFEIVGMDQLDAPANRRNRGPGDNKEDPIDRERQDVAPEGGGRRRRR